MPPSDGVSSLFLADENIHCGGLLTSNSGSFSSPWYPKKYPTNVMCAWDIQVDSRARVKLTFKVIKWVNSSCFYSPLYLIVLPATTITPTHHRQKIQLSYLVLKSKEGLGDPPSNTDQKNFFLILFIYSFWQCWIFAAVWTLLQLQRVGATLRCNVQASPSGGLSCCGAQALGHSGSSSCGAQVKLPLGLWGLPRPGIKLESLHWQVDS